MPATVVTPEGAPAASGQPSKVRQLLRRRIRQLARVMVVLAIGLALAGTALAIWWLTSLNGLPDIGDPFDVAAFRAFRIPDGQNAFAFFRRANERCSRTTPLEPGEVAAAETASWSEAAPKVRAWVEANRPALELFLQGAEYPDGISRRPGEPPSFRYSEDLGPRYLILLALLEGGRRAEGDDMVGAWACYRAVLHATVLSARRGAIAERYFATVHHGWLRNRLETWAADPRTTIPQLRRALEEAVESRPRPEWHAFSLRMEYLDWMRQLETMKHPNSYALEWDRTYRLGDMELPDDVIESLYHARRFLLREPERSRRAIRLLFANWLAQAEGLEWQGRKPAVLATFRDATQTDRVPLYPVGPEAPAGARVLSPRELASWIVSAYDMKVVEMSKSWPSVRRREQAGYRDLVIALARELYHRERGVLPPSEEALVGTYLESLPDDGSAEIPDKSTPTVPAE
jgi:hypothetical protein